MSGYDWDLDKARSNVSKHGVSFEEAETVLGSVLARWVADRVRPTEANRFVVIGYSAVGRLLVVIVSEHGPRPRIISTRRATKRERDAYTDR